jgi:phage-related protein
MKPLFWLGSTKKDLTSLPDDVQDVFGFALHLAQAGGKHPDAKAMKGFGGGGIIEVVEDYSTNIYRAVLDMDKINERLKQAEKHAKGG